MASQKTKAPAEVLVRLECLEGHLVERHLSRAASLGRAEVAPPDVPLHQQATGDEVYRVPLEGDELAAPQARVERHLTMVRHSGGAAATKRSASSKVRKSNSGLSTFSSFTRGTWGSTSCSAETANRVRSTVSELLIVLGRVQGDQVRESGRSHHGQRTPSPLPRGGLRDNVLLDRDGTFFHFGGALFARLSGLAGLRSDALRSGGDPRSLPKEVFARLAQDRWEQIEPMCGFGPFQRELSDAVRQASVIETVRAHDFPGWIERLVLEMDVSREQWNIIEQA